MLAIAAGAALLVSTVVAEDAESSTTGLERTLAAVSRVVEEIRGIPFLRPVPMETIDDAKARDYVLRRLERFRSGEYLGAQQRAYARMGLLPQGADILRIYLDVLEEQAGGYYDPETGGFYLLDDMPASISGMLMAHELTHAVEDQHFDLDRRLERTASDDDAAFAVGAVHEGSATLVMSLYLARALRDGTLDLAAIAEFERTEAARGQRLAEMPPILARSLLGPYLLGAQFLIHGESPSGSPVSFPVDDVAAVFEDGPTSSEQILHPEKYWDEGRRDLPATVAIEDLDRALGGKWERGADGVLGEIGLAVMTGADRPFDVSELGQWLSASWTNPAAAGWGGDRWGIWTRDGLDVVVLRTAWDTEDDAAEFLDAVTPRTPAARWSLRGRRVSGVWGAESLSERRQRRLDRALVGTR